ncbi:hypothetical protein [Streptosporangium sp. NPDC001681]
MTSQRGHRVGDSAHLMVITPGTVACRDGLRREIDGGRLSNETRRGGRRG